MENLNKYIPKEYLALKINYLRKLLDELPDVKLHNLKSEGPQCKRIIVGSHKYRVNTSEGQQYYKILLTRNEAARQLSIYEAIWYSHYKDEPLPECKPHKIKRTVYAEYDKAVVMDKAFFDSLIHDDNRKYPKNPYNFFNGTYYRSAAEKEIAIFYTELGIPFKYEPSIKLVGIAKPINPDFVLYFKELDTCKFHEHFGIKESADYMTTTKIKYGNYAAAGLIPDLDILFTYDTEDMPFDIRYLPAKLNSAVYGTAIIHKQ